MSKLLGWVRDTYRRVLHVGQVREWLGRRGITVAHLHRGEWWILPGIRIVKVYRYFLVQAGFVKWVWQWERRT